MFSFISFLVLLSVFGRKLYSKYFFRCVSYCFLSCHIFSVVEGRRCAKEKKENQSPGGSSPERIQLSFYVFLLSLCTYAFWYATVVFFLKYLEFYLLSSFALTVALLLPKRKSTPQFSVSLFTKALPRTVSTQICLLLF